MGQVDVQQAAALEHSLVMLLKPKQVKLLLFAVPVTPDALKNGSAVVKAMGHNSYLGFR
jgi:hypothetical protein